MVIRFKKGKNQSKHKPDTLTCIRDDGSVTWAHLHRGFVQHDIAHYVVETTLGCQNGFFGLVAKGLDIPAFSLSSSERPFKIPKEATDLEPIVLLLHAELWESFNEQLLQKDAETLTQDLSSEQIESMRNEFQSLIRLWENTSHGELLEVIF